ncbi:MAG: phosphopantetheine-binding protein [Arcobacteraceae bacterium]|jgi:acyl carrier protein
MDRIREILVDTRPEYDFLDEVDFIEEGMLDSFDVITLVTELEESFDIQIDGADIIPENFCSINAIKELILKSGGTI